MTLLILAGTAEARDLAKYCAATKIPAQASLSGATRKPLPLAVPTRHGGFGGADGFKTFIKEQNISAILDATHPFASFIPIFIVHLTLFVNVSQCFISNC